MADLTQAEANSIDASGGPWESMYQAGTRLRNAELAITSLEAQVVRLLAEGTIPVPLTSFRLIAGGTDIPTLAAAAGGVLAKNSSPRLERNNGATNTNLQITWSDAVDVAITANVPLPENLDTSSSLVVSARLGKATSGTNQYTGTVTFTTTFNEASAKTSTITLSATVFANKTHTITAGNVPASAYAMNLIIAPASHTATFVYMTGCRVQYARTLS